MATKGVLGNDPFQRGAAQRSKQSEPQGKARPEPEQAARAPSTKKAPRSRPSAKSASKAKVPAAPVAPAAAPAPQAPRAAQAPQAPRAAQAPRAPQAAKPRKQAPAARRASRPEPEEPKSLVEVPLPRREPSAPAVVPPAPQAPMSEVLQEQIVEAVPESAPPAAEPRPEPLWRLREQGLEGQEIAEAEERKAAAPEAAARQVEVPDASRDEYSPGDRLEAVVQARIGIEVEAALAPAAAASERRESADTSAPYESADTSARRSLMARLREVADEAMGGSSVLRRSLGALQGVAGAVRAGIGLGGSTSLDEYGRDAALVRELEPLMDFLYERYWRVTVEGAEHVPAGATLLVANHSGALPFDGPMLAEAVGRERPELREARWLVEDQVFYSPVLGTLFNRLGAVRACPENAQRLLDEKRPLIVFPEGFQGLSKPFAQRYQLKRFGRGGFVKLALHTGAPIVPVAIVGAEESSPLLARLPSGLLGLPYLPLTPLGPLPLPARWFIRFGEPITTEGLSPEAAEDTVQVQRLTERTREAIRSMLEALLAERRSVFGG